MKKIVFVTSLSNSGGTEIALINLLKAIPRNWIDITLFLLGEPGELESAVPNWIKIHHIKGCSYKESIQSAILHRKYCKVLKVSIAILQRLIYKRLYKQNKMTQYAMILQQYEKKTDVFDVAISWTLPSAIENIYTLENVCAKRKAMWVHMDVSSDRPPVDAARFYERYDDIFCVSNACKKRFDECFPLCCEKTKVFYNIIDVETIRKASRECVELPEAKFKIMTCGRLSSEKQPIMAVKIVKRLLEEGMENFKWYFIGGDGNVATQLRMEIKREGLEEYIILLGLKKNPYKYISKADLYIQMSRHESFCMTLAEAQILEIPSISTNFPSAYEIIQNQITGKIVENSFECVYDAIKALMNNDDKLKCMKENLCGYQLCANGSILDLKKYIDEVV